MRVIAGSAGGRLLKSVKGSQTRPTSDRVRESLFGICGSKVRDATVLDAFAGTGSVGIEAVSRGARSAVFVEKAPMALRVLRENLTALGMDGSARVMSTDAMAAIRILRNEGARFDLLFLDPPYERNLAVIGLQAVSDATLLAPNGWVIVQHSRQEETGERAEKLILFRRETYGDTLLSFYRLPEWDKFEEGPP